MNRDGWGEDDIRGGASRLQMHYRVLADIVVLIHLGFIVFAVFGGLLVLRWRRLAWIHVPAVLWGVLIEFWGWLCPLTPVENRLRNAGGAAGYEAGFVEHYLVPVIYPSSLTQGLQIGLGLALLTFNLCIYVWVWRRHTVSRC